MNTLLDPVDAGARVDQADPESGSESPAGTSGLSRRGFIRGVALAGGGLLAAACGPAVANWTFGPASSAAPATAVPSTVAEAASPAAPSGSPTPSIGPIPAGWQEHDVIAKQAVDRFVGGEYGKVPNPGNQPLAPTLDGQVKVFNMTVDAIDHQIDAVTPAVQALGFNGTWPGPILRVVEGDQVRATFKNNLSETTGIHFHGQALPNAMDGVPMITQDPIIPGASFTYEFTAKPSGSHMYHSHHNATDQVGRGLLGAFLVDPAKASERYDRKYGVTQDIVWISNDELGGFTINGRGFPATAPIVAQKGERIVIRFMNEGLMTHPWHLHGMRMQVVSRDGQPLGTAAFSADTLGVNPGERWDVIVDCENPGTWAFHCHILTHAEGNQGMYGMVTALIVKA
jgi:FtsP/CotA-like multicopper oxidase with cupredoxin domain